MGKAEIRKSEYKDLEAISKLYQGEKTIEELHWLLHDFESPGTYRSFIAVNEDNVVVGHIGYILSEYTINEKRVKGVHNMLWITAPDAVGFIGLKLISKTLSMGDFSFAIGSSESSAKIFPVINYNFMFRIPLYVKLLIPTIRKFQNKHKSGVSLRTISLNDEKNDRECSLEVLTNVESNNLVQWILDCPFHEKKAFSIYHNEKCIGRAICFINTRFGFVRTGRIIHISYLGEDELVWNAALKLLESYFKSRKCYIISIPVTTKVVKKSVVNCNYKTFKKLSKPFYLNNENNALPEMENDQYYLTFLEGDLSYRDV
jgi:hypothetical protein